MNYIKFGINQEKVGGLDDRQAMECWMFRDHGAFDIIESEYTLSGWFGYPETFVVEEVQFES